MRPMLLLIALSFVAGLASGSRRALATSNCWCGVYCNCADGLPDGCNAENPYCTYEGDCPDKNCNTYWGYCLHSVCYQCHINSPGLSSPAFLTRVDAYQCVSPDACATHATLCMGLC
jgi:hypothetical protein